MDPSRVLVIGLANNSFVTKRLLTNFNLDEYHTIILSPAAIGQEIPLVPGRNHSNEALLEPMRRRLAALSAWVSEGHNLIVVLEDFPTVRLIQDNRAGLFDLKKHELLGSITNFNQIIGERVECIGMQTETLTQLSEYLSYRYVLTSASASRILRVARSTGGTDQVVGLTIRRDAGRLYFLPPPKQGVIDFYLQIFASLPDDELAQPAELPEWVAEYENEGEARASAAISELLRQIDERQAEVEASRQALAASAWMKQLFAGSGDDFADAVSRALKEMGLEVEPGPHPRADLLIRGGNNIGATRSKRPRRHCERK